jgi:hypothetical protein
MLNIPPPPSPRRRVRAKANAPVAKPLTLVAAVCTIAPSVKLTFDRPIDISAMDVSKIHVDDSGALGGQFEGTGDPELAGPNAVTVMLTYVGDDPPPGSHLTVEANNGIVAQGEGGAWGGVTDLSLPFP